MSQLTKRKREHLILAQNPQSQSKLDLFSHYELPYRALPEIDLDQVDTSTILFNKKLSQPLIIASMTGGTTHSKIINKNLSLAAAEYQVAMGVGSQRIALVHKEIRDQFTQVRKHAPKAVIFANMGAVQLNYGYGVKEFKDIVEMIKADALYLHLNPLQEAIQPEGDTNFNRLTEKIINLIQKIGVPVFIKEVGHGLDQTTYRSLLKAGLAGVDIAGVGGTSWAWIESKRAKNENLARWFKEFGIMTDMGVLGAAKVKGKTKLVASGGIRSPLDGLKIRAMGADYYSAAYPFLKAALTSVSAVGKLLDDWQRGLQIAMFVTGVKNWQEARKIQLKTKDEKILTV